MRFMRYDAIIAEAIKAKPGERIEIIELTFKSLFKELDQTRDLGHKVSDHLHERRVNSGMR